MPGRDWGRKKMDALTMCLMLDPLGQVLGRLSGDWGPAWCPGVRNLSFFQCVVPKMVETDCFARHTVTEVLG